MVVRGYSTLFFATKDLVMPGFLKDGPIQPDYTIESLTIPVFGFLRSLKLYKLFNFAAEGGSKWVYGTFKSEAKWASQMSQRGWTEKQITEAITKGKSFNAVNNVNKANSATRYVHPTTGKSVVVDDVTKELL